MYGDQGLKLVREAKRLSATPSLPEYNEFVVREILKEISHLAAHVDASYLLVNTDTPVPSDEIGFLYHHASLERNKQCLLAYHRARLYKLTDMVWQLGGTTTAGMHLNAAELAFANQYLDLLFAFKGHFPSLDLVHSAHIPPKDLFITVRVVKDCGTIVTETGRSVRLSMGSMHFLKRTHVEHLITLGYLVHVD